MIHLSNVKKLGVSLILISGAMLSSAQRGMTGYVPQVNAGERDLASHHYLSAASHFRYALIWDRKGAEAHDGLGNVYLKLGLKERALQQFATVLERSPHHAGAERGIHEARSEGEEQQAFQDLEDQVERNPKDADLETTYAEELIERGRLDEATKYALDALAKDSKQWHAHCALGRIALAKSNLGEARSQLSIAVSKDDNDDDALEALAKIEMADHHPDLAAKWLKRLIAILPDEAQGHEKLSEALEQAGDHSGASQQKAIADKIKVDAKGVGN